MADLIRASSLSWLPELVREHGGDPTTLLAQAGIDPVLAGSYDRFIPFSSLSILIGQCAQQLGVPDFALQLARRQDPDILGPVALVARNADTIGAAVGALAQFAHVYSPALSVTLQAGEVEACYEIDTVVPRLPHRPHVVELALGVTLSTFKMLDGPDFQPTRVAFQHARISEIDTYTSYFGCHVEFGAPRNELAFRQGLLQRHIPRVDRLAYDLAISSMAGQDPLDRFTGAVSTLITRTLPSGTATLETVANLMAMHPRTLQRRLSQSGHTFQTLVDDNRREVALHLLANPDVQLSAIAQQLGYTEASTLTRSSRRWFGMTPLAKRRSLSCNARAAGS